MGVSGAASKFLGIFFILSLLLQGVCAAEESNEANTISNYTINDTINDTVNGTIIGTINGTINGTISNTEMFPRILLLPLFLGSLLFLCWLCRFFDRMNFCFVSFLLIVLLLGLLWRFQLPLIDLILEYVLYFLIIFIFSFIIAVIFYENKKREGKKGNKKVVSLLLIALLLVLLWSFRFQLIDLTLEEVLYNLIVLILISIFTIIIYNMIYKNDIQSRQDGGGESNERAKSNLIMWSHDIARNFIIIFVVLGWPIVLLYLDYKKITHITFYGIEKLQFPVYIIAASFVGILTYLFLSIEERFSQLMPEYMKMSIAWSYLKRTLTAPFIALVGFYLLNHLLNIEEINEINDYFVFVFSFFAGVFTKTIETWIFSSVQRLLPGEKKIEFDARTEYKVENSCFVTKLRLDEEFAYVLYSVKIRTIEDLASFNDHIDKLIKKVNLDTRNLGEGIGCPLKNRDELLGNYTRQQLQMYTKRAKYYTKMDTKSSLVKDLNMNRDLAFKLCIRADIKDLEGLKNCDPKYVHKISCDYKTESQEDHDRLCECSEEIIQNFKEKAKAELKKRELKDPDTSWS